MTKTRDPRDVDPDEAVAPVVPATTSTEQPEVPASASSAPAVPLAGVPQTPLSEVGIASTGPAIPSTDHMDDPEEAPDGKASGPEVKGPVKHRD